MSTHSRSNKANGTTSWADGDSILASEHNEEWDDFLNDYNGNITNANISGSAAIAVSKLATISLDDLDDHSVSDAEFLGVGSSLGDSFSTSKPTDASEEILALRRRIKFNAGGTNLKGKDDSAVSTLGWIEPPCIGPNLLSNPGFEEQATGGTSTPSGWTLDGTPTLEIEAADAPSFGIDKRSLKMSVTGGIEQTVTGLKASTKYRLIVLYRRTTGTLTISTEGALGSGDYQNYGEDITSGASVQILQAVVKTDSTPTDVSVHLDVSNTGDSNIYYVSFREMADDAPLELPSIPTQTATHNTAEATFPASWTASNSFVWEEVGELALSQYVPSQGYRLIFTTTLTVREGTSGFANSLELGFRVKLDGAVVDGPYFLGTTRNSGDDQKQMTRTITMMHVVDNPAAGATYDFTVEAGGYDASGFDRMTLNPISTDATTQSISRSRLVVEKL